MWQMSTFSKRRTFDGEFWKIRVRLQILSYFKKQLLRSDLWAMKRDSEPQCCGLSVWFSLLRCHIFLGFWSSVGVFLAEDICPQPLQDGWHCYFCCCCSLALSLQAACPETGVISDPGCKVTCCLYSNGLFILLHTEEGFSWLRIILSPGRFFSVL